MHIANWKKPMWKCECEKAASCMIPTTWHSAKANIETIKRPVTDRGSGGGEEDK